MNLHNARVAYAACWCNTRKHLLRSQTHTRTHAHTTEHTDTQNDDDDWGARICVMCTLCVVGLLSRRMLIRADSQPIHSFTRVRHSLHRDARTHINARAHPHTRTHIQTQTHAHTSPIVLAQKRSRWHACACVCILSFCVGKSTSGWVRWSGVECD